MQFSNLVVLAWIAKEKDRTRHSIQRFNFSLIMRTTDLASVLKRGILPLKILFMAIKNGQGGGGENASP